MLFAKIHFFLEGMATPSPVFHVLETSLVLPVVRKTFPARDFFPQKKGEFPLTPKSLLPFSCERLLVKPKYFSLQKSSSPSYRW